MVSQTYIMYVVVQFYHWFNFYFPLFLCMVMHDNEYETKENKNWIKDKLEPQHVHVYTVQVILKLVTYMLLDD